MHIALHYALLTFLCFSSTIISKFGIEPQTKEDVMKNRILTVLSAIVLVFTFANRPVAAEEQKMVDVGPVPCQEFGKAIIRAVSDAEAAGYTVADRYVERGIPISTGAAVNYTLDGCMAVITLNK